MNQNIANMLNNMVKDLQDGLLPEVIAEWYDIIINKARDLAPPHLKDKINVEQDELLPMRFKLDLSKRAVPFVVTAIEESMQSMPYSTRLYFEKVKELIIKEFRNG